MAKNYVLQKLKVLKYALWGVWWMAHHAVI